MYLRFGVRTPPLWMQRPILTDIRTSTLLLLLCLPLPSWPLRPSLKPALSTMAARLERYTAGLLHDPRVRGVFPQRLRTHHALHASVHIAQPGRGEATQAQWESRRRLDWTGSSAAMVDLGPQAIREAALAPAPWVDCQHCEWLKSSARPHPGRTSPILSRTRTTR